MAGTTFDWTALKAFIGVETSNEDQWITDCFIDAQLLISDVIADAFREIPASILKRMILLVGYGLYKTKDEPSGIGMYATFDGGSQPVRTPRDPLHAIRPMLAMYVRPF